MFLLNSDGKSNDAGRNISLILVTLLTFQPEISWLNLYAPKNMADMSVALLTSHPEMSSLNVDAPKNSSDMSVTSFVHHVPIGIPHVLPTS